MHGWRPIMERYMERYWCFYSLKIQQLADRLVLSIPRAGRYYEGPYRCVSNDENVTEPDNSSQPLSFKVHCECVGWRG